MGLEKYKAKRKFDKTPEPRGKVKKTGKDRFVIHKHSARNLHYDLRLEIDGVLKSWAVPKIPPRVKGVKRLAVQVEDHPIDYIDFCGVIPEGNYGAGMVSRWDFGTYKILEAEKSKMAGGKVNTVVNKRVNKLVNKRMGMRDSFKFELMGKKLKGEYALVKMRDGNWLFFKVK